MTSTETTIELAGLHTEVGALVLDEASERTPGQLLEWLRKRRVAAAIIDDAGDEIVFSIAYNERGRVQGIGTVGELIDLMTIRQFCTALAESGLGIDVSLRVYPVGEDPEGAFHDPAEDEDVAEDSEVLIPEFADPELVYSLGPDGVSSAEDFEWKEAPPLQVWEFSRRGLGQARIDYLFNRVEIRIGAQGQWSAFGLVSEDYGRLALPTTEAGLPLITAQYALDGERGWVEVVTSNDEPFGLSLVPLGPVELSHEPDEVGPEAQLLLTLLGDENREAGSAASLVADNPLLEVDEAALYAALGPSERSVVERVAEIVAALGLPADLVEAAFAGDELPQELVIGPASRLSIIADIVDFGLADLAPRSRKLNLVERAGAWVRQTPVVAAILVMLESAVALSLIGRAKKRSTGGKLLGFCGAVMLADAAIDAGVLARRAVRSQRNTAEAGE